jgi:CRP-like cAMP-binding protein
MNQLIRQVRAASAGDLSLDWLKPFSVERRVKAGEVLFREDDVADEMFFVVSGRLRLHDSGVELHPGAVVGELGLLAPGRRRTQTLECVEDATLLRIGYDRVEQLYFQNPKFGFYFLRLTTARLFENLAALERRLGQRETPQAEMAART